MLNMANKNISMDAQSTVNGVQIASMNASISSGMENMPSSTYFNISVNDMEAFIKNKAAVMSDFSAFCDKIIDLASTTAGENTAK
jgi:hypothetical protein